VNGITSLSKGLECLAEVESNHSPALHNFAQGALVGFDRGVRPTTSLKATAIVEMRQYTHFDFVVGGAAKTQFRENSVTRLGRLLL